MKLTAGLKCAPEIDPNILIITYNMAPVAMVFPKRAIPIFPLEIFSAMIPEPITTEINKNVPMNSARYFTFQ